MLEKEGVVSQILSFEQLKKQIRVNITMILFIINIFKLSNENNSIYVGKI